MQATSRCAGLARAGVVFFALSVAAAVQAAEITIFTQPNFDGRQATLRNPSRNLADLSLQDQASSAVIRSGTWELCSQPDFGGDCITLGPGQYPRLDPRVFHRLESAREVPPAPQAKYEAPPAPRAPYDERGYYREREPSSYGERGYYRERATASIELYADRGFRGPSLRLDNDAPFMGRSGFNDQAASAIIHEGVWELCTGPRYGGICRTFGPGRYSNLGEELTRDVSSVRRIS